MNSATFAGRLGRDAETRNTQSGTSVTGFSLAVEERRGGEKTTLWIDCSMWGERGEKVAEYLTKGTAVAVSGQIGVRTYEAHGETKAVITLNVRELTLLGGRQDGEGAGGGQRQQQRAERPAAERPASRPATTDSRPAAPAPQQRAQDPYPDDDIPF